MPKKRNTLIFQNYNFNLLSEQVCLVEVLDKTIRNYKDMSELERKDQTMLNKTVDEILSIMKENQIRHETRTASTASSFNLMSLQNLPKELLTGICQKLNLSENDYILKEVTYSTKTEFAEIIRNYNTIKNNPKL